MKLCPQCAFIYEDDQRFCDMDGNVLVHGPAAVVPACVISERRVAPPTRLTINIPARSPAKRFPVLIVGGVVLAMLLSAIYFAQLFRARSLVVDQAAIRSRAQSTAVDSSFQTSTHNASTSAVITPLPDQSDQRTDESFSSATNVAAISAGSSLHQLKQTPSNSASLTRARLPSNPVSAGGLSGNNRSQVVVRLTNGAGIKADEAWERSEGLWYRQGSVVTLLKRSRVKTIERSPQPGPTTANVEAKSRTTAQNQLRLRRLEAAGTKKPSRLTSFLKATGRAFKKPFKF